jgi:hypothetical protein
MDEVRQSWWGFSEVFDKLNHIVYYVNNTTGDAQWDRPEAWGASPVKVRIRARCQRVHVPHAHARARDSDMPSTRCSGRV